MKILIDKIFISSYNSFNCASSLVVMQPDLGTAILIAAGGIVVAWLAGVRAKFFAYALLILIASLPIAISF